MKLNAYEATLKAADWIEKNPELFKFSSFKTPADCGTPACALGWVGYFMGMPTGTVNGFVWKAMGGDPYGTYEFYRHINIVGATALAASLRAYAEKYLRHLAPTQSYDWEKLAVRLQSIPMLEAANT